MEKIFQKLDTATSSSINLRQLSLNGIIGQSLSTRYNLINNISLRYKNGSQSRLLFHFQKNILSLRLKYKLKYFSNKPTLTERASRNSLEVDSILRQEKKYSSLKRSMLQSITSQSKSLQKSNQLVEGMKKLRDLDLLSGKQMSHVKFPGIIKHEHVYNDMILTQEKPIQDTFVTTLENSSQSDSDHLIVMIWKSQNQSNQMLIALIREVFSSLIGSKWKYEKVNDYLSGLFQQSTWWIS